MPRPENNLLLRLHKWASRQDENFLTEAFAHLLLCVLENEPEAATRLFHNLSGVFFQFRPEECKTVEVRTQVITSEGTPHIEIRAGDYLAFVEVKSESVPNRDQLHRYRSVLGASGAKHTRLIFLTRYPADSSDHEAADAHVRWYEVADWIEQMRSQYNFKVVTNYVVDQFVGFLTGRNMTMQQVTWELSGGVRALRTLMDMLYEAANACNVRAQPYGSRYDMGYYLEKRSYWIGIKLDQPEFLNFYTWYVQVDPDAAVRLGIDGVSERDSPPGSYRWNRMIDLESEEVHFFSRSKANQMKFLESFLRECIQTVKQIELPDQIAALNDSGDETLPI